MTRYAFLPVVVGLAALFSVLPHTGGNADISITTVGGQYRYQPAVTRIGVGERIAITNETRRTHTATCTQPACWDSGDIQPGETVFLTFDEEGSYGFICRYHETVEGFGGRLIVGDIPEQVVEPSPTASATSGASSSPGPSPGASAATDS